MDELKVRMKELIGILNKAAKEYYVNGTEIMSNYEYDALYDELEMLEEKTGIRMSDSPTIKVGYEVLSELPKEVHEFPMLSLKKTKNVPELTEFLADEKGLLSWKMDGLTVVLTYENGELIKAVTRGNGLIGEIITNNAKVFKNIPLSVSFKEKLTIRGEAVIHYSDFEKINELIPETDAKYKNPRNLCSGSVRQLDNKITKERNVHFYAFDLVQAQGHDFNNSKDNQFKWLKTMGFDTVEYVCVNKDNLKENVEAFEKKVSSNDFPSDGLVLLYDDIRYGESLGTTAKYPRNAMAFKWKDETMETVLRDIEWSASRTGLINPIAVFDEVSLEGTNVSRASLHNLSYVKDLKLGIGDRITVFKANMIIPQIAENLTKSDTVEFPEKCPVCDGKTVIKNDNGVMTLYCSEGKCPAKHIKKFAHFVSRDAMNIEGLSEMTIEKFIDLHFIKEPADIYRLDRYRDRIVKMEGFGEKSFIKISDAINKSRDTDLFRVIYGLGIPGIGLANAKMFAGEFKEIDKCISASEEELMMIDGFGDVLASSVVDFFKNQNNIDELKDLLEEINIKKVEETKEDVLKGKTFVITGSLNNYENRSALKEYIEKLGGKTSNSVSSKTSYLINNDTGSSSEKNRKAKELGIPVISEKDFELIVKNNELM